MSFSFVADLTGVRKNEYEIYWSNVTLYRWTGSQAYKLRRIKKKKIARWKQKAQ